MSFNEAACCFDASMYTGVPDAAPCAQSLDIKGIIAGLDKLLFSGDDAAAGERSLRCKVSSWAFTAARAIKPPQWLRWSVGWSSFVSTAWVRPSRAQR